MSTQTAPAAPAIIFDLTRIVRSRIAGTGNYGITKYANELLRRLLDNPQLSITPSFDTRTLKRTWFLRAAPHFRALRQELDSDIYLTRRELKLPLSYLHQPPLDALRRTVNAHMGIMPSMLPADRDAALYFSPHGPLPPRSAVNAKPMRVITVHDVLQLKFPEYNATDGTPYIRRIIDSIDPITDFVICDTKVTQQDLFEYLPIPEQRTRVIHLAADDVFHDAERNRTLGVPLLRQWDLRQGHYLLALAQDDKRKNIKGLIQAYAALPSSRRDSLPLALIASHQNSERKVRQWLDETQIPKTQVRILMDVSTEQLAMLYASARMFIYPSFYEGFGIPLVEAMASGCPVLASNTSTHPEVLGDAAVLFDPNRPGEFSEALSALVDRQDRLNECRERGLHRAGRFVWSNTSDQTAELLLELARTRHQPA
jgi:alpha-1,3-rhamnosyl/mannosyltransferase